MHRRLFSLFLVYIVIEGALRKWVFPSLSTEMFLFKDILVLSAASVWFLRRAARVATPRAVSVPVEQLLWGAWLLFFGLYAVVSGASMTNFIGLRYYLIMLPVAALVPAVLRDKQDMETMARRYFYLLLPVGLTGIVQYYSPPESTINRYAWSNAELAVAVFGQNKPRITGTFSYISPYTAYLQFMVFVGWCIYLASKRLRDRVVTGAGLGLIFINIAMSGSRGPFGVSLLFSLPFLLAVVKKIAVGRRRLITAVVSISVVVCSAYFILDPFTGVSERQRTARDAPERILGAVMGPVYTVAAMDLAGIGIGETFLGGQELYGRTSETRFEEVTQDRIGIETGIVGYAIALTVKIYFLVQTWKLYRRADGEDIRSWILACFCYQASLGWSIPVYNSVAVAYYFLCIGMFYWFRAEQRAAGRAADDMRVHGIAGRRVAW